MTPFNRDQDYPRNTVALKNKGLIGDKTSQKSGKYKGQQLVEKCAVPYKSYCV